MSDFETLVAEETLIVDATEAICERMDLDESLTRKGLAKRLGRSKGFVSQILSGERNMTLRTLAQFADALGCRVEVKLTPIPAPPGEKAADPVVASAIAEFERRAEGCREVGTSPEPFIFAAEFLRAAVEEGGVGG